MGRMSDEEFERILVMVRDGIAAGKTNEQILEEMRKMQVVEGPPFAVGHHNETQARWFRTTAAGREELVGMTPVWEVVGYTPDPEAREGLIGPDM